MIELLLTIVLALNVMFLGLLMGQLNKIYNMIRCAHDAEIKAHTQGWVDCIKCMDALEERKEE